MDESEIRKFIQANLKHFGPDGLGWPRPGGLPKFYAQHPEEWSIDLAQVEDLRRKDAARARADQMARTRAAAEDQSGGGATGSSGMSDDTRSLFRKINQLSLAGRQVKQISDQLSMPERLCAQRPGPPAQRGQPIRRSAGPWTGGGEVPGLQLQVAGSKREEQWTRKPVRPRASKWTFYPVKTTAATSALSLRGPCSSSGTAAGRWAGPHASRMWGC